MRHVEVVATVHGLTRAQAFTTMCDFAQYPKHSPAVRSVRVAKVDDRRAVSDWEVSFREGVLRWKEEDVFSPDDFTIRFRQIEGDVDYFAGQWSISETSQGCLIRFACDFDLGIPGLDDILEPIAEQALRDNTRSILKGLIHSVEFPAGSAQDAVGAA